MESSREKRQAAAQEKIAEQKAAHDIELVEQKKSRRLAWLGGISFAATGIANVIDMITDYIPDQWEAYTIGACAISAAISATGLSGIRLHDDKAALRARMALVYAVPNDIPPPEWTYPYIEENSHIFAPPQNGPDQL